MSTEQMGKTKSQKRDVLSWQAERPGLQLSWKQQNMVSWLLCEAERRPLLSWFGEGEG